MTSPSVAFVGLGYIGLPTAVVMANSGLDVVGVDVHFEKVEKINRGEVTIVEPGLEEQLEEALESGRFRASIDMPHAAAYIIAVPTPFTAARDVDMKYIYSAVESIAPKLKGGELIVLESTSPPLTTDKMASRVLELRPDLVADGQKNPGGKPTIYFAHCPRGNRKAPISVKYPDFSAGSSEAPSRTKPRLPLRAAVILDEFSYMAWETEFALIPVTPQGWKEELAQGIDFLLVESAWAGNAGAWQYQLTGSRAPTQPLQDLVQHCRKREIPTVFWNKEDPPHFKDFVATAKLFDIVFTTDSNKVEDYQRELGHDQVFVLPFAAQPKVHNPARNKVRYGEGDAAFAGTYFRHKFPERRTQMELILGAAANVADSHGIGLAIFSRHAGKDEKYQFPASLDRWVAGSLPYSQMLAAYRSFKVFLNVNSVVDSPSMCARRIFEICASGTPVLTTPSAAISNFFPENEVPVAHSREHAGRMIRALVRSPELRERMVHRAQRRIWENHTYHHRAVTIANKLGLDIETTENPAVSIICSTNRDTSLHHLLEQVAHQNYPNVELIALAHGIDFDSSVHSRAEDLGVKLTLLSASADTPLGAVLNQLVDAAHGEIIAKFDDDDFYRPNYLRDQVLALRWSDADLVGKASIYFHLADSDLVVRRWQQKEHKWTNFVAGATLVGWKRTFLETRFQEVGIGEDSRFLKDLEQQGKFVYSTDRFNFMATRNGAASHTWDISDAEILSYSTVETTGLNLDHITV